MALIVDASVAFKWFLPEEQQDQALALLDVDDALYAPDLILAEVSNAMWVRLRRIAGDHRPVVSAAAGALPRMLTALMPAAGLLPRAIELAFELTHPVYDCVYLALAEQENTALVTADRRLIEAATDGGYATFVKALA